MTRRLEGRLDRLARRLPPPPPAPRPGVLSPEELDRMSDDEVHARFAQRMAEWDRSPAGMALARELDGLSDEELIARWESMPRYRDGRGGKGGR